ncbi:MAG: hypothetical protein AB1898_29795 [Acidobacteriota bacterium]
MFRGKESHTGCALKLPFTPSNCFNAKPGARIKLSLSLLVEHHGVGLLTGEVSAGKSTAVRQLAGCFKSHFYKLLYRHWTSGSALGFVAPVALGLELELDLEPLHRWGDLVRQISDTLGRLNKMKKQHPLLAR